MKITKTYKSCLWWILFVISIDKVLCQQDPLKTRIHLNVNDGLLSATIDQINKTYPVHLFYVPEQLANKKCTTTMDHVPLDSALSILLNGTGLDYFIYRDYAILIAQKSIINSQFSSAYYQSLHQGIVDQQSSGSASLKTIGNIKDLKATGKAKVFGTIIQQKDKSPIIGATIKIINQNVGTVTDEKGFYAIDLPVGKHQLSVQYIGNTDVQQNIQVYGDGMLNLSMETEAVLLDEVVIGARAKDANVENVQIGVTQLDVKSIHKLPAFLGEADVVKSLLYSPGVSTIGEGATGFNVRGGDVDQNLMMQDEGMVYNSSHALGFFSAFHTDLIRSVTLYKSIMPAQYGGRLASVLDVELKDGNFEKYQVKAGIGPVSSKVAIDGPIIKNRTSLLAGFRSSYADWILKQAKNIELKNSTAFFYDANLRLTHRFNDRNHIMVSMYQSKDNFVYNKSFGFDYHTQNYQAILKNIFSPTLFSKLSIIKGQYKSTQSDFSGIDASSLDNEINFINLKEQITLDLNKKSQLITGISSIYYINHPGSRNPLGEVSRIFSKRVDRQKGLESAIYANMDHTISPRLQISVGFRVSTYQYLGPGSVFGYQNDDDKTASSIIDTTRYNGRKIIKSYLYPEPRVSARWRFTPESSLKAGYSRTVQYLNQIFNSDSPTPTSQYQLSTNYIEPNTSHNASVGYFKNFKDNVWESSVEIYGRLIDRLFDYKDFAELTVNEHLETEILSGKGRAYGLELSIKKNKGLINGLVGYTYSRTMRKVEGINSNKWYANNFDKPHDLRMLMNYQYNQRHTFTINFTYSTGRPTTAPQGGYRLLNGVPVPIYSARNALRIPDYHRMDLAYTLGKGYRKDKKFKTSWTFSLYNVYARKNAFSVYFTQSPFTAGQANKLAVLGTIFPSLTFNIESQ